MKPTLLRIRVISFFVVFSLRHAAHARWALVVCLCAAGTALGGARINGTGVVYSTVQAAVDAAQLGNRVHIATGLYFGTVNVPRSLTLAGGYDTNCTVTLGRRSALSVSGLGSVLELTTETNMVTLTDLEFTGGNGFRGGGVYLGLGNTMFMDNCLVHSNSAQIEGGGIWGGVGSSLICSNTIVCSNTAAYTGGGIAFQGNLLMVRGDRMRIFANRAENGGGVHFGGGVFWQTDQADIYANVASNSGGGLMLLGYATAIVCGPNCTIGVPGGENVALTGNGGGVCATVASMLVVSNEAAVLHNRAALDGGGIYASNNITVLLADRAYLGYDSPFVTNLAGRNGGGLCALRSIVLLTNAVRVSRGVAEAGGGLYLGLGTRCDIVDSKVLTNRAETGGGIRCVGASLRIAGEDTDVRDNYALEGGGVSCSGGTFVQETGADIHANIAVTFGGGAFLADGVTGVVRGSGTAIGLLPRYDNMVTNGDGGGMYLENAWLVISNSVGFARNSASRDGGALYAVNSMIECYDGVSFGTGNSASTNSAGRDGGGVFADACGLTCSGNVGFECGVAGRDGGACRMVNSTGVFILCEMLHNRADRGGALFADGASFVQMSSSCVAWNWATNYGGIGLTDTRSQLSVDASDIVSNYAHTFVGGLYCAAPLMASDVRISANRASGMGGCYLVSCTATFTNCEFNNNTAAMDAGGLQVASAMVTLRDTSFADNVAGMGGYGFGDGGAAVINNSHISYEPLSANCSFARNAAWNGGAIYADAAELDIIAPANRFTTFFNNTASNCGGAVYLRGGSTLNVQGNVRYTGNDALHGGGLCVMTQGTVWVAVSNNYAPRFYANTARGSGGAIYAAGPVWLSLLGVEIGAPNFGNRAGATAGTSGGGGLALFDRAAMLGINCAVCENSSANLGGGLLALGGCDVRFDSDVPAPVAGPLPPSVFLGNYSSNSAGGAFIGDDSFARFASTCIASNRAIVFGAGGIYFSRSTGELVNVVMARNNSASEGDGIYCYENRALRLLHCTIADNSSYGVYSPSNPLSATNCIVWGHFAEQISSGKSVAYSDVEDGYAGTGNLNANPLFVSAGLLNYALQNGSPCINTGVFAGVTEDILGYPRPFGPRVDLGAYEFVPEPGGALLLMALAGMAARMRRRARRADGVCRHTPPAPAAWRHRTTNGLRRDSCTACVCRRHDVREAPRQDHHILDDVCANGTRPVRHFAAEKQAITTAQAIDGAGMAVVQHAFHHIDKLVAWRCVGDGLETAALESHQERVE